MTHLTDGRQDMVKRRTDESAKYFAVILLRKFNLKGPFYFKAGGPFV